MIYRIWFFLYLQMRVCTTTMVEQKTGSAAVIMLFPTAIVLNFEFLSIDLARWKQVCENDTENDRTTRIHAPRQWSN